jgi:SAM-dependent methyltransferase
MERSYDDLRRDPAEGARAFGNDYAPLAPVLKALRGRVLDIGGGLGVTRHWLEPGVRYTLVEPSPSWKTPGWDALAAAFPCLRQPLAQARGVGEELPFRGRTFDAVIALWVLNHAADPARMLDEAARVLHPGGKLLLVLEDMEPSWADLRAGHYPPGATVLRKLSTAFRPWPLQEDHLRIREHDLRRWLRGRFVDVRREWLGVYLGYQGVRS